MAKDTFSPPAIAKKNNRP